MTDLADLMSSVEDQDRGAELVVLHPITGEPMDIKFTLAGPDSERQRTARLWMERKLRQATTKGRPSPELQEEADIGFLARCIVTWDVKQGGEPVPFTVETAERILRASLALREQVALFSVSRAHYLREPAL